MVEYTAHFRIAIPDFNQEPWHDDLANGIRAIDTALYNAVLVDGLTNWANSTAYVIGSVVIDGLTGIMWTCGVAHTSPASPTTFAADRVANPTRWNQTANIPQQRGTWTTATSYTVGDFVVDSNRYAVCLVSHVSGVFNTDLAAAKWVVLIDLSTLGIGMNADAEGSIASAGTTDIGGQTQTRLHVTGTTTITSFGVVANVYKILRFQGILTLTHNATSLILLGGVDRNTAAGDIMWVSSDSTGKWRELMYNRATGVPLGVPDASDSVKGIIEIGTQGEVDAGTDPLKAVVPLTLATRLAALEASILSTIRAGVSGTLDTLAEIATAMGLLAPKANPTFTGTANFESIAVSTGSSFPAGDIVLADLAQTAKAFQGAYFHAREEQTNGTDGSTFTLSTWNTRVLNQEKTDDLSLSISSNQISLVAGTYYIRVVASTRFTGAASNGGVQHCMSKLRLRNITDGSNILIGMGCTHQGQDDSGGNIQTMDLTLQTFLNGRFTLAGTKTVELQNWVSNALIGGPTARPGKAISSGDTEVYTDFELWRIG
jgi:hypothetical protein